MTTLELAAIRFRECRTEAAIEKVLDETYAAIAKSKSPRDAWEQNTVAIKLADQRRRELRK